MDCIGRLVRRPSDREIASQIRSKKEPHDETHHAALKMPLIAPASYFLLSPFYFRSYTRPSVASVGSSMADVTAKPLSAW
jgi:hypothetical protein